MLASPGASGSIAKQAVCVRETKEAAAKDCPPTKDFYVPYYNAPDYREFVREAQLPHSGPPGPRDGVTFAVDSSRSTSQYDFGQTSIGASASPGGWFSPWSVSGQHTTKSETFSSTAAASSISVKLTWDKIEAITVTPGQW